MFYKKLKKRNEQLEAQAISDAKKIADGQEIYDSQLKIYSGEIAQLKKELKESLEVISLNAEANENVESNIKSLTEIIAESNKAKKELEIGVMSMEAELQAKERVISHWEKRCEELLRSNKMLQNTVISLRGRHMLSEAMSNIFKSDTSKKSSKNSGKPLLKDKAKVAVKKLAPTTDKKGMKSNIAPVSGASESKRSAKKIVQPAEVKTKRKYVRKNKINKK